MPETPTLPKALDRSAASEAAAEEIGYGIFCLDVALWRDADRDWRDLPQVRRELYLAKGRFVLASAEHFKAARGG